MTGKESAELLERVVRLEVSQEHMGVVQEEMSAKVNDIHKIMQQAKGAKWTLSVLLAVGSAGAAVIGWFLTKYSGWHPTPGG